MKRLLYLILLICPWWVSATGLSFANLIGIAQDSTVYSMDTTLGTETVLGTAGFPVTRSLAQSPGGVLYSVGGPSNDQLITINPTTGAGTAVATLNYSGTPKPSGQIASLAFNSAGELFMGAGGNSNLYRINPTSGVTTLVGSTGIQNTVEDLAFSPSSTLYGWMGGNPGLVTINPSTGQATPIGNPNGVLVNDMTFDADGTLWTIPVIPGGSATNPISKINLATGAVTAAGLNQSIRYGGIQFVAPVPVPAALWLFGSGLVALAGFTRRNTYLSAA